ncbi:MAG: hypothetical protein GY719_27010 [bacterium]|nr:hypothetical protein [bacterium]
MPWLDWQFWMVTAAALWGAWILVRQLMPVSDPSSPACASCATGAAACARRPRLAETSPLVVLQSRQPPSS